MGVMGVRAARRSSKYPGCWGTRGAGVVSRELGCGLSVSAPGGAPLVRARGTCSWERCTAQDGIPSRQVAPTVGGAAMSAPTGKMPGSCAQVVQTLRHTVTCTTPRTQAPAVLNLVVHAVSMDHSTSCLI